MQQRTIGGTVEVVILAHIERVEQRSAEKFEVAPRSPGESVEPVRLVSQEKVQQRTVDATKASRQKCPSETGFR